MKKIWIHLIAGRTSIILFPGKLLNSQKFLLIVLLIFLVGCTTSIPEIPIDSRSIDPGTEVMRGSDKFKLLGTPIKVGDPLPSVSLINRNLQSVDLAGLQGEVLLISVVPSLDTQVCERQTRTLAQGLEDFPETVKRITISRDLPFAQKRFSDEVPHEGELYYLSDYAEASFGRSTGLLIDKIYLLARAVIVVDRQGIVRYLQVVPTITHLPDLKKGMEIAAQLAADQN